jgi:S1-C subfamily serine protease
MTTSTVDTDILSALSNQMADAVERVRPALVLVNGRQRQPASGVVFAPEHVLTADHVIDREEDLTIETDDGRSLPAQLAGRDPVSDLALLKVAGLALEPAMPTNAPARVGQVVLAVGRPSGNGPMASLGIVSAVGGPLRTSRGALLDQFIQIDATPYPGFSGGPLVDPTGAVIGILTTGLINGVPLVVPAAAAWRTAETLAQQGHIKRGYLGVSSQPVELPGGQQASGLLIVRVEPDSPASRAGLLLGDVLTSIDGRPVADTDDLQAHLSGDRVGATVAVEVIRGGAPHTLSLTIGQRG